MEVNKRDIEQISKKLLNIKSPPVLWSSIRIDGNCFFHAIDYANRGKLLSRTSNKSIELRQQIVSTMNKKMISGVTYEEFMNSTKNGKHIPWPYSETDVIIAAAKYYKKTIVIISMSDYGGVTMIRPKGLKIKDPLFLICQNLIHFVPFHSDHVKITNVMRNRLEQLEQIKKKDGAVIDEDGAYVTAFLLNELTPIDSLSLTRKRLNPKLSRRQTHSHSRSYTKSTRSLTRLQNHRQNHTQKHTQRHTQRDTQKHTQNPSERQKQINNNAELARRLQQINNNYEMAKRLQYQD